jgi:hypothetical protein
MRAVLPFSATDSPKLEFAAPSSRELLHLTPRAIRLGEHIERALACVAAEIAA